MIRLSKHISDEMAGRGISLTYIEAAVGLPDRTASASGDVTLMRSFKAIPAFGGRVLRVVHRSEGADIFVVAAQWDRGARR